MKKTTLLKHREFGDPVLRQRAKVVSIEEIASDKIQSLIANMRHTLLEKNLGIALAAPQVGESLAVVIVAVRPQAHRPNAEPFDLVLINPEITESTGDKEEMWEGCVSSGATNHACFFAKVPRYNKLKVRYHDENGKECEKVFTGLKAQIMQHEVDHLEGTLFVDRVEDTKTYMTYSEYMKMLRTARRL